jgi:hypothetical protein
MDWSKINKAEKRMRYTIMHKDIPVIDIDIDQETKVIAGIGNTHNKAHPPAFFIRIPLKGGSSTSGGYYGVSPQAATGSRKRWKY